MNQAAVRTLPMLLGVILGGCAVAQESSPSWTLATDDAVTWETVHVLSQASSGTIADETGSAEVRPVLSFRCTEGGDGSLSMQIDWQRFISSFNTEAGFRIDDGSRSWLPLSVDDSNRVTLSRSASDVTALIESLRDSGTLNVEIAPYSEPSVFVDFDLSGFSTSIDALTSACE